MLETADQLIIFENSLKIQGDTQLKIERDTQTSLNLTQGLVIASVRNDAMQEEERRERFAQLMGTIELLIRNNSAVEENRVEQFKEVSKKIDRLSERLNPRIDFHWNFERLLPYEVDKRQTRVPLLK